MKTINQSNVLPLSEVAPKNRAKCVTSHRKSDRLIVKSMRYFLSAFLVSASLSAFAQGSDSAFIAEITAHRQHYKDEFISEPRSPLKVRDTAFLDFYAPEPAWRVPARVTLTPDAKPFDLLTYSGVTRLYRQYATLHFEVAGRPYSLNLYQNLTLIMRDTTYRDYLFLPFKDATNGAATYGGGRYLDFHTGDIRDGVLALDFNKAYNPYCAYSDGYNCPIPPRENHLILEVKAGEKAFLGEKKH